MIEGTDFLELAGLLAAQNRNEIARRSAVSRAYYGAFHLSRSFLKDVGIDVPANAIGHGFVFARLQNCRNPGAAEIGSLLIDLRSERNRADYDLSDRRFETIENVRPTIETAMQIQRLLLALANEPARTIIRGIARYHQLIRYHG